MSSKISQHSLAKQIGVSVATVNRALGNHRGTNPATRAKVLKLASEMGYRIERLRNSPEEPKELTQIGVLMYGAGDRDSSLANVELRMLSGITAEAKLLDVSISVDQVQFPDGGKINDPAYQAPGLRFGQWQGAILCGHYPGEEVDKFAKSHLAVQIADYIPGVDIDYIDHDDMASCETLVEYLWRLGHRRIGFFSLSDQSPCFYTRYSGHLAAMRRRGSRILASDIIQGAPGVDRGRLFADAARLTREGVTAWMALDDYNAYSLAEALKNSGLNCPEDVSICGFDNLAPSQGLPKMTSIDAPFEKMGAAALRRLLSKLHLGVQETVRIMLKTMLVEGASCAQPRSAS